MLPDSNSWAVFLRPNNLFEGEKTLPPAVMVKVQCVSVAGVCTTSGLLAKCQDGVRVKSEKHRYQNHLVMGSWLRSSGDDFLC